MGFFQNQLLDLLVIQHTDTATEPHRALLIFEKSWSSTSSHVLLDLLDVFILFLIFSYLALNSRLDLQGVNTTLVDNL